VVVVSDTTAITNLLKIKLLLIMKGLYGEILIPNEVYKELAALSKQKKVIGLLGILVLAKEEGQIPKVEPYMKDLKEKMGFRISEKLYKDILIRVNEG
jgi:predicted nucleic acid-binding protein